MTISKVTIYVMLIMAFGLFCSGMTLYPENTKEETLFIYKNVSTIAIEKLDNMTGNNSFNNYVYMTGQSQIYGFLALGDFTLDKGYDVGKLIYPYNKSVALILSKGLKYQLSCLV